MNREEKKKETVNRIIGAALQLFSEKGYEETTVAEIAKAAGIAKGTFFNYFKTKEDVLIKTQKALFFDGIIGLEDKTGPYAPRILALVKEMGDAMNENRALMRLSLQRFLTTSSIEHSRAHMIKNIELMIPTFEKGQQTGEFTTTIPASLMARTAIKIYFGTLMSWSLEEDSESLGEQLLLAFQVFLQGIVQK